MTNDHIQRVLAMAGSLSKDDPQGAQRYVLASNSLLAALVMPGSAISIADEAAWELIESECCVETSDGIAWCETHSTDLRLVFSGEEEAEQLFQSISNAVTYLTARGLLVSHPDRASLVRRRGGQADMPVQARAAQPERARTSSYVDCGECPRISTGCENLCDKALTSQREKP